MCGGVLVLKETPVGSFQVFYVRGQSLASWKLINKGSVLTSEAEPMQLRAERPCGCRQVTSHDMSLYRLCLSTNKCALIDLELQWAPEPYLSSFLAGFAFEWGPFLLFTSFKWWLQKGTQRHNSNPYNVQLYHTAQEGNEWVFWFHWMLRTARGLCCHLLREAVE